MDFIFGLAGLALIALWVLSFIGLLFPAKFQKFKKSAPITRKDVFLVLLFGSIILILLMVFNAPDPESNGTSPVAHSLPEAKPVYEIVADEKRGNITRKIEVELPTRLNKSQLETIANEIKNADSNKYERTFIMYRIKRENSVAAWATTHFDPDLSVKFIGLSADDFKKLLAIKLDIDGEVVGQWLSPNGLTDHIDVIYKKGQQYFKKDFYLDATMKPDEMVKEGNTFRYKDPAETQYFVINSNGDLEYKGSTSLTFLAKKLENY
ncbi:hypothetical protein [Acinetobacter courvalinii]|uniref:Uncharacterized protein n=1 Tax=Acinetobacter courvalinii TaxID=280147 RepID=N9RB06_9GAMM|nr:hypothetical protein [Acinetobacter courvalinii]ENX35800.1 hypothetical protein F888_03633 [Acinetobacter courvalinii]KAB0655951.1 hypothetical protein F7P77_18325 [Acinetobacter courvalinii]GGH39109.1 hypothetical protein GCM10007354_24670 [Acinetobacter courvalinii]